MFMGKLRPCSLVGSFQLGGDGNHPRTDSVICYALGATVMKREKEGLFETLC